MSAATPNSCACPSPVVVAIPGTPGNAGTAGTNGNNAYSLLTATFVVPATGAPVAVSVDNNSWMVNGSIVAVSGAGSASGPGYFQVTSTLGTTVATLQYLTYPANTQAGTTISIGSTIAPSGPQVSISNLGNAPTVKNSESVEYSLTATTATITGQTLTVPASGLYLILARASVDFVGATFASPETITVRVQDTTSATTLATTARTVQAVTTTPYPSHDFVVPVVSATLAAGDVIALQIGIAVVPSAGTATVNSVSLVIVPLLLS